MFQTTEQSPSEDFCSYSKHLRMMKNKELSQIKRIKPKNKIKQSHKVSPTMSSFKEIENSGKDLKTEVKEKQTFEREKWIKIDDKAVIVNGKLVYIEQSRSPPKDNHELIDLLNENGIRLKDYIYGNQKEILTEIDKNYQKKKDE